MERLREEVRPNVGDRGKPRVCQYPNFQVLPPFQTANLTINRGARLILEAYWKKIDGKPITTTKLSKKRSRASLGNGASETPKKQKRGRKSAQTLSLDQTPEPPTGFTAVGDDEWKPPSPNKDAWDPLVQAIDTIEKDDDGELWAYLVWNDKNADGRFYRSKARVPTCNQACPQRVMLVTSFLPFKGSVGRVGG